MPLAIQRGSVNNKQLHLLYHGILHLDQLPSRPQQLFTTEMKENSRMQISEEGVLATVPALLGFSGHWVSIIPDSFCSPFIVKWSVYPPFWHFGLVFRSNKEQWISLSLQCNMCQFSSLCLCTQLYLKASCSQPLLFPAQAEWQFFKNTF